MPVETTPDKRTADKTPDNPTPDQPLPTPVTEIDRALSPAQLQANRANSKLSQGPTSIEGRARSANNAFKHGLTSRRVHVAPEDQDRYEALITGIMSDLRPHTTLEHQLARNISDGYWRLSQVRSIEEVMQTLTPPEPPVDVPSVTVAFDPFGSPYRKPESIDPRCIATPSDYPPAPPPDPDLLDAARVWLEKSTAFTNITLYEQRINRQIKLQTEELHRLQTARHAEAKNEMPRAIDHRCRYKMLDLPFDPASNGFVFSSEEIEDAIHRDNIQKLVDFAKECDFKRNEYEKRYPPKAA